MVKLHRNADHYFVFVREEYDRETPIVPASFIAFKLFDVLVDCVSQLWSKIGLTDEPVRAPIVVALVTEISCYRRTKELPVHSIEISTYYVAKTL